MKKFAKYFATVLAIATVLCMLCACNNDSADEQIGVTQSPSEATAASDDDTETEDSVCYDVYDISFIDTLGQYKGIEIEKDLTVSEGEILDEFYERLETIANPVNDDELDEKTLEAYNLYAEKIKDHYVTDRAAQEGDYVCIDYTGYLDGEAFDGGSATAQTLRLGSGNYVDGFEEQIIGHKTGEEFSIDIVFPEDYGADELNGKTTEFVITLQYIFPELNDENVAFIDEYNKAVATEDGLYYQLYTDKASFIEYETKILKDEKAEEFEEDYGNVLLNRVYQSTTFNSFPTAEIEGFYEDAETTAEYYGYDVDTYLYYAYGCYTEEDQDEVAKNQVGVKIIIAAIVQKEGITISDDEFTSETSLLAANYGYDSSEELIEVAGENAIRNHIYVNKVVELLQDKCVIKVVE